MRRSPWSISLLGVVLLATGSCRFGSDETGVQTPPLLLRSSTPSDSAEVVFAADGLDVSLNFNRATSPGEVRLLLEPLPLDAGDVVASASGRTLTWFDVEIESSVLVYNLLVDGPAMPAPRLVNFHPGPRSHAVGRLGGELRSAHPSDGFGTAIFALRLTDLGPEHEHFDRFFDPPLDYPVEAMTLAREQPASTAPWYLLSGLEDGVFYAVVGILDGNGDGLYEIQSDWWGYYHTLAESRPRAIQARLEPKDQRNDLDFELVRPGVLTFGPPIGLPERPVPR